MTETFTIPISGPFSLAEAATFLDAAGVDLALLVEGSWTPAAVAVNQHGDTAEVVIDGENAAAAARQVARMLSLDVDGAGWPAVAERDEVVAMLQRMYPGFRPVLWASAYEAAAWSILSTRISMRQAGRVKDALCRSLGVEVATRGGPRWSFPSPKVLAGLGEFPGLFGRKAEYLRALGERALAGELDTESLRALPSHEALARLRQLPGIGPFGAQLVRLRACAAVDELPTEERRLDSAVRRFYHPQATLPEVARAWRPYTMWACVSLRRALGEGPGMGHLNGATSTRVEKKSPPPPASARPSLVSSLTWAPQ